ncbi:DUF3987 domain-containing protein [Enterobacterales bacterium BD_CKDN230030183-1A_HGKHYDSX7]
MDNQTLGQLSGAVQDNNHEELAQGDAAHGAKLADVLLSAFNAPQQPQQQAPWTGIDGGVISAQAQAPVPAIGWPPGNIGRIAHYIYASAPRPVPEVAIVAALGLIAGICGRRWNTHTDSGLNIYINLVARSAVGKETLHTSVGTLQRAILMKCPTIGEFANFNYFASGPALVKEIENNPCFINVLGELGKTLTKMASDKDGPYTTLRTQWTNLYSKSGRGSIAGGIAYSNQENNASLSTDVAFSVMGETTPTTFYSCLTSSMMEDGFMSRFLTIEYTGERPPRNRSPVTAPDEQLVNVLMNIAMQATQLDINNIYQRVPLTPDAERIYDAFEEECDNSINDAGDDEPLRQVWNRAALKMLRIACLGAVSDNHLNPSVTREHIEWALRLVRQNITLFVERINSGDIGSDDYAREQKVLDVCRRFLGQKRAADRYEKSFEAMKANAIVPRSYLQTMTQKVSQFVNHRLGSTAALEATLRSLVDCGNLALVDKHKIIEGYSHHGNAYRVLRFDFSKQNDESAARTKFWPD